MYVVDQNLSIINNSWWNYSRIYPMYIRAFEDCAATAGVTGCTMLFNHEAKDCCMSAGPKVFMHDCWVCLCTLQQGGTVYGINKQLVLYRQHGSNCLGSGETQAADVNMKYRVLNCKKVYKSNRDYYAMLRSLGYGSVFKYIRYKLKYKKRIRRGSY